MVQLGQTTGLRAERCSIGLMVASQTEVAEAVHRGGNRTVEVRSAKKVLRRRGTRRNKLKMLVKPTEGARGKRGGVK